MESKWNPMWINVLKEPSLYYFICKVNVIKKDIIIALISGLHRKIP